MMLTIIFIKIMCMTVTIPTNHDTAVTNHDITVILSTNHDTALTTRTNHEMAVTNHGITVITKTTWGPII